MSTEISELKRESLKMLYRKKILTESEYMACKSLLTQMAIDKNCSVKEYTTCDTQAICLQDNVAIPSGAKAIAFPFYIENKYKKAVSIDSLEIKFITKSGKGYVYDDVYYLTRTGPVKKNLVLGENETKFFGPIILQSDIDYETDGLSCVITYKDYTHKEIVTYEFKYKYIWKMVETQRIPFNYVIERSNVKEYLERCLENYNYSIEEEFQISNLSISEGKSYRDEKNYIIRGEIYWDAFEGLAEGVVKTIIYDAEDIIIHIEEIEVEIKGTDEFEAFEMVLSPREPAFWNSIHRIAVKNNIKKINNEHEDGDIMLLDTDENSCDIDEYIFDSAVYSTLIDDLRLDLKTFEYLRNANINIVGDLRNTSIKEITEICRFSDKSRDNLLKALNELGISIKSEDEDVFMYGYPEELRMIAKEKKEAWEYRLYFESIIVNYEWLKELRIKSFNEITTVHNFIEDKELVLYIANMIEKAADYLQKFGEITNEKVVKAVGLPGEEGNENAIIEAAEAQMAIYKDMIIWSGDIYSITALDKYAELSDIFIPLSKELCKNIDIYYEKSIIAKKTFDSLIKGEISGSDVNIDMNVRMDFDASYLKRLISRLS